MKSIGFTLQRTYLTKNCCKKKHCPTFLFWHNKDFFKRVYIFELVFQNEALYFQSATGNKFWLILRNYQVI